MRVLARRRAVGVALGLLAAAPAGAADLTAPPPPRLGACGAVASGFPLPGSDGCLRIDGFVRAEGAWALTTPAFALAPVPGAVATRSAGGLDRPVFGTGARLSADLRLPTELGPLRLFVSLRGHRGAAADGVAR